MGNRKGLSQILYLIIAASVLMIAALSLVFMLNDGLSGIIDLGGQTDTAACERQLAQRCADGASTVETPGSCLVENADGSQQPISGVDSDYGVAVDTTSCPSGTTGSTGSSGSTGGSTGGSNGGIGTPGIGN